MKRRAFSILASWFLSLVVFSLFGSGQSSPRAGVVPAQVKFNGTVQGASSRMVGITFALYRDQQGGAPLWLETQSVSLDPSGRYTVQLGATLPAGLPMEVFVSGEARWLGVQPEGQAEQPRVLLLSVPYALKAADAETIGGLPPSAFVLAPTQGSSSSQPLAASASTSVAAPPPTIGGSGTLNFVPLWTPDGNTLGNSVIFQSGSGTTAKIGIQTTTPATTLDVKGKATIRGTFALPATGNATATAGNSSQPIKLTASAFNSGTSAAVNQNFQWQAEAANNNTSSPSGTINLLYSSGTGAPAETGLKIGSNGQFTFVDGQTFPGTGTITGVTAGTALTGGGSGGNITLNVDTSKIPQLNTTNIFTGSQTVNGALTATGSVSAASLVLGGGLFAYGDYTNHNSLIGFSGSGASTGGDNTANGTFAFQSNTSGSFNLADGSGALAANTTGGDNTATGSSALASNKTGSWNTASGQSALSSNVGGNSNTAVGQGALLYTTGSSNTGLGYGAGPDSSHAGLTNSTAIGANATVTASNSLVLGSINGLNGATADTNVGIGTPAPAAKLDVRGTANFTGPITFAAGQTFPGTGTITGVTPGTALTGGGSSGSVTLNVDTTKVVTAVNAGTGLSGGGTGGAQTLSLDTTKIPQLAAANNFTGNQTVNGNLTASGVVSGSSYQIGSNLFAFGNYANDNAFLGFSGNAAMTGVANTADGYGALSSNQSGAYNTANGVGALSVNTTGNYNTATGGLALYFNNGADNTATGADALQNNVTGHDNTADGMLALGRAKSGNYNTASGVSALYSVDGGSNNTGVGYDAGIPQDLSKVTSSNNTFLGALASPSTGMLTNVTAIGANAVVSVNNALVLGSINGINSATADTSVGIGTTAPATTLDVEATAPALVGPVLLLKNKAPIQSGTFGNSVDFRFAIDSGSSAGNPNAYIRAAEDGNSQYGAWISFATMADGGAGSGPLERMRITSNGLVGINTAAPDATLSVNGSADKPGGGSWGTFSDMRLKNVDGAFNAGLDSILQLQPVRYRYRDDNAMGIQDRDQHVGFVAQEVQKVIPEAVSQNDKGYLLINNDPILWTMLNAIKEQQQQIRQQRLEIQGLKAKLGALEKNFRKPLPAH